MYISDGRSIININEDLLCVGKETGKQRSIDWNYWQEYYLVVFYKNQEPIKLIYVDLDDRDRMYSRLISILDKLDNEKYIRSDNN